MKYGVFFPNAPLSDLVKARDLAQDFEGAGFDYFCLGGHVLMSRPGRYAGFPEWVYATPFTDPFVMFGYLAGFTSRIHMMTSISILPAMSTALVARQAVELAFVSGDRFELGVGLSWQEVEFRGLGYDFSIRGRRMTEQVQVLKRLWSEPLVTYKGEFHDFDDVGLGRLPNKPIPLWLGSSTADKARRRVAAYADGWMTIADPTDLLPTMREYLANEGRDPDQLRVMFRVIPGEGGPEAWIAEARRLKAAGVTHLTIWPRTDYEGTDETGLRRVIEVLGHLRPALD